MTAGGGDDGTCTNADDDEFEINVPMVNLMTNTEYDSHGQYQNK